MLKKILTIALLFSAGLYPAIPVKYYDGDKTDLADKWAWAVKSSQHENDKIWIGYSIARQTDRYSRIGSWSDHQHHPTLYDVLGITRSSVDANEDIAFLFLTNKSGDLFDLKIGSFDSEFNLHNYLLYWLEEANQNESTALLERLYEKQEQDLKKDIVAAFGLHSNDASTLILKNLVKNENEDIQKDAVFWLGQPGHNDALEFLVDTLNKHPRESVRKAAVFSASQMGSDQAVDAIIKAARSNSHPEIRKEAIFWLGQMAAEKSTETLKSIVYDEPTLELKKQAVFSLSQIDNDSAIDDLIDIAKTHPNAEVRKSAIFWLGESGSDKALDVLVGLLKE